MMANSEVTDGGEAAGDGYRRMISREEVIKCPHMMVLTGYLTSKHNVPRYGWLKQGLRYHYTDASGLIGIVQSGRLWATDIRFLNDPSEGTFLPERLLALMSSKVTTNNSVGLEIISGIRKALSSPRSNYATFCVSLSANGDLLSQWRGYGGFGKGYAIGLNLGARLPHPQVASFYDVVYGDQGLEELADDLLDLFISAAEKWNDIMYEEWASTLNIIAKSYKDYGYSEEQESRLICIHSERKPDLFESELPLKFRARGGDLIPYIPMSLDLLRDNAQPRLPIEHIIVGPGVDFDRNHSSIKALLKACSYDNVKVEASKIPFRS